LAQRKSQKSQSNFRKMAIALFNPLKARA